MQTIPFRLHWVLPKIFYPTTALGLPQPNDQDREEWPFNNEILPSIDEDGVVIMDANQFTANNYARTLQAYNFDENRMYLWPIPATDRFLNANLTQNPGY